MAAAAIQATDWLTSEEMARLLGMHYVTLRKLKQAGYFTENRHFRRLNPTKDRSHLRWHRQRTLERMRAV
jgi:hypothetical protein